MGQRQCPCLPVKTEKKHIQVGDATTPKPPPVVPIIPRRKPSPLRIRVEEIDVNSLNHIVEDVDFSSIINEEVKYTSAHTTSSTGRSSSTNNLRQKKSQNISEWKETHFLHGKSHDIVTDVLQEVHGCINSSVSENIDIRISRLHQIDTETDAIFRKRLAAIASKQKVTIDQLVIKRQEIIEEIIKDGRDQIDQSEGRFQQIIEDFITELEVEMSKYLDELQRHMEKNKDKVLVSSHNSIAYLEAKVQKAKTKLFQVIETASASKRKEIFDETSKYLSERTSQLLGFEQYRKFNMEMYSTVGTKEDEQGCENITERKKFRKLIRDNKSHGQMKRTVYVDSGIHVAKENHKRAE
ncbi:unnamed protein product [Rotaria magnacalcarata]|uniref:Uncharacterized protein n=2 Tax=Rotaria magnacalcarata TaxID=392030 RepID=A0A815TL98_9BILA|nr:unnamed protein product [Rotaria magnacalcarata]